MENGYIHTLCLKTEYIIQNTGAIAIECFRHSAPLQRVKWEEIVFVIPCHIADCVLVWHDAGARWNRCSSSSGKWGESRTRPEDPGKSSPRMTGNSSSSSGKVKRRPEDPGETNVPLNNIIVEIFPHWISFFYESYFPLSHLMLEIFFSLNCWCHSIMTFIVYEIYNIIFICESFEMMIFMFKNSLNKVTCYTDIESTIFITCHDISTWLESSNTVFHIEDSICPGFSGQAREWRRIVRL